MKLARLLAAMAAAFVAFMVSPAAASTLTVVGSSAKVCQLTGETDWLTGAPTNALTETRNGLQGIDLGFPVESDVGELYFLFGDAVPPNHPPGPPPNVPPDDGMGKTKRTAQPDSKDCLDMTLFGAGRPGTLGHPTVTPPIQQGAFNVPTGGVYVGGKFFAFFWTNHCIFPDLYGPNPATPLKLPPAANPSVCPENANSNALGRSVLAYSTDANPLAFTQVAPPIDITYVPQMPYGFNYVSAAVPAPQRRGVDYKLGYEPPIPVFGVARYRMSIPYLALAPQQTFGAVSTWKFYGGTGPSGPIWLTYQQWQSGHVGTQWAPPAGAEIYVDGPNAFSPTHDERCVGEHSATWNEALGVWLLLYTCGGLQVEARTAPDPWGPWSAPTVLLSSVQDPGLYCTLFWTLPISLGHPGKCPGRTNQQTNPFFTFGYFYAPFVMTRYTQNLSTPGGPKKARIYWLLSTWDPYEVVVMQSTLELAP